MTSTIRTDTIEFRFDLVLRDNTRLADAWVGSTAYSAWLHQIALFAHRRDALRSTLGSFLTIDFRLDPLGRIVGSKIAS